MRPVHRRFGEHAGNAQVDAGHGTRKRAESPVPAQSLGLFKGVMKGCFLCLPRQLLRDPPRILDIPVVFFRWRTPPVPLMFSVAKFRLLGIPAHYVRQEPYRPRWEIMPEDGHCLARLHQIFRGFILKQQAGTGGTPALTVHGAQGSSAHILWVGPSSPRPNGGKNPLAPASPAAKKPHTVGLRASWLLSAHAQTDGLPT